jgi:N-acetyltransferase 10
LNEEISPRPNLPPLLQRLAERPPEQLDYIGASFGLTLALLKFWKRLGFVPVYLRQNANKLTGEHSCIMVNSIVPEAKMVEENDGNGWFNFI